jgi:hypothetical protein
MKKLIAVLMAMLMVFSCVPALGEETGISINVPSFTLTSEVTIDEEQVMALLPALGMPEETVGMVQTFLPMLNGLKETLIFADMGLQYDVQMKGQDILSVVGEASETGLALATNLVPSYKLTIQAETIQKLVEQLTEQLQGADGKLDMELLQQAAEKLSGYATEMANTVVGLVTFGEPVKGEYADLIEGVVFNTEMSLTVDVKGMVDAMQQYMTKVMADETILAAIQSIASSIPGASFDPSTVSVEEVPAEQLPDVTGKVYTITDDEGNQVAPDTYVVVNAVGKEDQTGNTNTYVYVAEDSVNVVVEVPAQEVSIQIYAEQVENGMTVNIALSVPGFDCELAMAFTMTETGMNLDGALYLNDAETPILVCSNTFSMTGERTKTTADGEKTELALEGLMNEETSSDTISALLGDLMNGVGGVISNISAVLPEQGAMLQQLAGSLMSMFTGGGQAVEAPAE